MTPILELPAPGQRRGLWIALLVALAIALTHIILTWGIIGTFWGDTARWMGEVERYSRGEAPYRDFTWSFPPLGIWVFGEYARVFGAGANSIWAGTAIVFLLIVAAFVRYLAMFLEKQHLPMAAVAGVLLAIGYSSWQSAGLAKGIYIPSTPLGFLFLLLGLLACLELLQSPRVAPAIALGVWCGLAVLAKQDFWFAAGYLLAVAIVILWLGAERRAAVCAVAACGLVILCAAAAVGYQSGWVSVAAVAGGFGHVSEFRARLLPVWSRIVSEIAATAMLGAVMLVCLAGGAVPVTRAKKWLLLCVLVAMLASAAHVAATYSIGREMREAATATTSLTETEGFLRSHTASAAQLLRRAVAWLKLNVQAHLFPALLPGLLGLAVLARWKRFSSPQLRNTVLFLAGFCMMARSRRMISQMEWYHFLLEIPLYVLAVQLFVGQPRESLRRALTLAMSLLLIAGLYSYWTMVAGPFTERGTPEAVDTPQGRIGLAPREMEAYRVIAATLARLDPEKRRPLFASGTSGGFNYFFDRANPTPLTQGFRLSNFPPDKIVEDLRALQPRPILIYNAAFENLRVPSGEYHPLQWELKMQPSHYTRYDLPFFQRAAEGCAQVEQVGRFTVLDCR